MVFIVTQFGAPVVKIVLGGRNSGQTSPVLTFWQTG
jgi:hypothetical protein